MNMVTALQFSCFRWSVASLRPPLLAALEAVEGASVGGNGHWNLSGRWIIYRCYTEMFYTVYTYTYILTQVIYIYIYIKYYIDILQCIQCIQCIHGIRIEKHLDMDPSPELKQNILRRHAVRHALASWI